MNPSVAIDELGELAGDTLRLDHETRESCPTNLGASALYWGKSIGVNARGLVLAQQPGMSRLRLVPVGTIAGLMPVAVGALRFSHLGWLHSMAVWPVLKQLAHLASVLSLVGLGAPGSWR